MLRGAFRKYLYYQIPAFLIELSILIHLINLLRIISEQTIKITLHLSECLHLIPNIKLIHLRLLQRFFNINNHRFLSGSFSTLVCGWCKFYSGAIV